MRVNWQCLMRICFGIKSKKKIDKLSNNFDKESNFSTENLDYSDKKIQFISTKCPKIQHMILFRMIYSFRYNNIFSQFLSFDDYRFFSVVLSRQIFVVLKIRLYHGLFRDYYLWFNRQLLKFANILKNYGTFNCD